METGPDPTDFSEEGPLAGDQARLSGDAETIQRYGSAHPDGFTVAQFRDVTGSTRKHALPLAAELDARGVTRRRDDLRIGGPKLPNSTT